MCAGPNLQKFFNFLFSVDQVPVDYAKCEYDYLDHYGNDITSALSNIATKEECKCLKTTKILYILLLEFSLDQRRMCE